MEIPLSIAIQLVGGQADYLVKVGRSIFGVFLAAADCTVHKLLAIFRELTTLFC